MECAYQQQPAIFQNKKHVLLGETGKKKLPRYYESIRLGFKTPKEAMKGTYVDKKRPFSGLSYLDLVAPPVIPKREMRQRNALILCYRVPVYKEQRIKFTGDSTKGHTPRTHRDPATHSSQQEDNLCQDKGDGVTETGQKDSPRRAKRGGREEVGGHKSSTKESTEQGRPCCKDACSKTSGQTITGYRSTVNKEDTNGHRNCPSQEEGGPDHPNPASFPHPTTQRRQRLKASDFKSEPRWDFEEEYSLDVGSLQTTCPDSVKIRASQSPWLKSIFLPNITLFLDSGRFNQSEWNRLEHFAPPFGFMELNQSLVQKVVSRFPPVPQQQFLLANLPSAYFTCITCAVVGNGGILNNSRMGQEIDSHDYVFRLSGAVIKGYEQDVRTRTSFYGFTAFSLVQSVLILGRRGFQHVPLGKDVRYLHFLEGNRDYEWLEAMFLNRTMANTKLSWFRHRPQEAFREALDLDRYLLLHPDFLRYMKNRFLRSKTLDSAHWRIYRPTTGALLLLTALHLCDKVSAYGFITQGHERFSDHYYDTSWKRLIFYINHDFTLERTVWKRLHDEGIIRLYQRPQSDKAKN